MIFMRFCCFKLSKKIGKLSNEQPTHNIAKCTLTGLVFRLRNLTGSEIWSHACIFSTTLLLPSTATHAGWNSKCHCCRRKNKQKTACIREILVHKLWTKVYSQKGLTGMLSHPCNLLTLLPVNLEPELTTLLFWNDVTRCSGTANEQQETSNADFTPWHQREKEWVTERLLTAFN